MGLECKNLPPAFVDSPSAGFVRMMAGDAAALERWRGPLGLKLKFFLPRAKGGPLFLLDAGQAEKAVKLGAQRLGSREFLEKFTEFRR